MTLRAEISLQTNDLLISVFFLRRRHKQIGKNFKFGDFKNQCFKNAPLSKTM